MSDNTTLPVASGGDVIRDVDKAGVKSQVVLLDIGGAGAEALFTGAVTVTGVATATKQDTGNTSLGSIDGKLPALGQALAAGSVPVVLTAAQLSTLTPVTSITANAGTNLNTSALALEAGGNLAAIKADVDKIPSQGQALAAASMPVVLPAAQITTLTPPAAITGFALDSTVAKDASLTTIDTDIKATQPRDVTDRAARLVGVVTAANLDVASSTLAKAASQDSANVLSQVSNQFFRLQLIQAQAYLPDGFVPIEIPTIGI